MRPLASLALSVLLLTGACVGGPVATGGSGGPGATRVAAPSNSPLIGSWVTTITRGDLEAAGITDPGLLGENSGRFTWTFNPDGTWQTVQVGLDDNAVLNPVFGGTFLVDGDSFVATTTFPEQYRDEGLRYTWGLAPDGSISFGVATPPDPVMKVVVEAHPWLPTST